MLILREVLSFTSAETAALLDTSLAAVNSALQRARATLATDPAGTPVRMLRATEQAIMNRFVDAWHARDITALAALLREDVTLHMPPDPWLLTGRDTVTEFLTTVPAGGRLDLIRLVATRANGAPALAAYLPDDTGTCRGYGIMVFTVTGERIAAITGFPSPHLFGIFGLPAHR